MTYYDDSPDFNQEIQPGVIQQRQELLAPSPSKRDNSALTQITRGEMQICIEMAQANRRNIQIFTNEARDLVTKSVEIADECIYALPRGGKSIEGPSIRFAEIIAQTWRNNTSGARPIAEDDEFITVQGVFRDYETNMGVTYEVKRRITDKDGKRYNADMIATTTNAGLSIARRNAILGGIPRPYWEAAYQAARKVVAGDVKTLGVRRDAALKHFLLMGVKPEQIYTLLDVRGIEDITSEHLLTLRGVINALKEGSATVESIFAPKGDENLAAKSAVGLNKIKERYSTQPAAPASAAAPPATSAAATGAPAATVPAPASSAAAPPAAAESGAPKFLGAASAAPRHRPKPEPEEEPKAAPPEPTPAAQEALAEPEPALEELWSRCHQHGDYQGAECPKCAAEETHPPVPYSGPSERYQKRQPFRRPTPRKDG
jgi:hypothetical protein